MGDDEHGFEIDNNGYRFRGADGEITIEQRFSFDDWFAANLGNGEGCSCCDLGCWWCGQGGVCEKGTWLARIPSTVIDEVYEFMVALRTAWRHGVEAGRMDADRFVRSVAVKVPVLRRWMDLG